MTNHITVHIDKKPYKVDVEELTGAQLRALSDPDISAGYELLLEVPGGDDRPIGDDETVALNPGIHFFSAPRNITPGR
jgi:hypothetical protein